MKKAIISRTFTTSIVDVLSVDKEARSVKENTVVLDGKIDTVEKAVKYFDKHDRTVVDVLNVKVVSELLGMYESDFITLAKPFDERSKDTRNLITKNCVSTICSCMVVSTDRKIVDIEIVADSEKECRKEAEKRGYKFVAINNQKEVTQLYGMDSDTFRLNAKRMVDRFTLEK